MPISLTAWLVASVLASISGFFLENGFLMSGTVSGLLSLGIFMRSAAERIVEGLKEHRG